MTKKAHPHRSKDMNQLAKYIVDLSTGNIDEKKALSTVKPPKKKNKKK